MIKVQRSSKPEILVRKANDMLQREFAQYLPSITLSFDDVNFNNTTRGHND